MIWNLLQYENSPAVILPDGSEITYRQLSARADALAEAAGGRCLALILCSNTPGSLIGYVSFLQHGIVPIMTAHDLDRTLLATLTETYRPALIWLPAECAGDFPGAVQVYADAGYVLLKTGVTDPYPLHDDLALLLTTSGSTGSPKLVRQSARNIISNMQAIAEYLRLDSTERPITTLPMQYTYGLSIINSHLYVGAAVILTDSTVMQREFWQIFRSLGATSFGGVPYIYEMLDKLRFFRMQLPSLRTMTQAGGKLSPELHRKYAEYAQQTGKQFVVMYGQTEATARMAYLPPELALEKCGSMGIAIPGGRFSLIDADGSEITAPDTVGELVYEGDNVALGYAVCGDDLAKGDEWHGRNVTGDMAKRDADGCYYITGRKKRFLKLFGSRVNLDETERILHSAFPDTECVCGGVDDRMYIFVTAPDMENTVQSFLAEKLGFHFSAFTVVQIPAIPRSDSGKVLYGSLEQYYA